MIINDKNLFINKYVIVAFIVTLLNIFLVKEKYLLDFFVIIESLFLIYLLLKKRFSEFLIWLLIFLSSSIEFRVLVTNDEIDIYGFKHFRVLGINLGVLFVLISFFLILFNKKAFRFRKKNYPTFTRLLFLFFTLFCSGFLVGIFNILINDNGIRNIPSFFSIFILETYMAIWPFLLFYMSYFCLVNFKNSDFIFEKGLMAVFIANCTAPLIPAIFGVMGSYSHLPYMLISSSAMLSPFILLFILYPEYKKHKNHFIFLFIGGTVLPMLFFNYSGGKLLIILLLLPIIYFLIKIKSSNKIIKPIFSFSLVTFFLIVFMNYLSTKPATLFESKSREVESIVDFGTNSNIENLNPSVYFRAVEVINLIEEYSLKPHYLLTGKGYMGSIKEHLLPKI